MHALNIGISAAPECCTGTTAEDVTKICSSRGEKREWRKHELSSAVDPAKAAEMRASLERADAFHHRLCDPLSGLRTVLGDVVADPLQVIRGRRPPDAVRSSNLPNSSGKW